MEKKNEIQADYEQLPEAAANKFPKSEENETQVTEEEDLMEELEKRRSLRKRTEFSHDAEPLYDQETKDYTIQELPQSELTSTPRKDSP